MGLILADDRLADRTDNVRHKQGFARIQSTRQWQARQAARRRELNGQKDTPPAYGWQKDDNNRWWLPGVTDVYLEVDRRFPNGWALVYDEFGGHRIHVPLAMLKRVTEGILEDNGL